MKFSRTLHTALTAWLMLGASLAAAQPATAYPARPVKVVVPYAPGGMTDVSSRAVMERLGKELGQPVVIENKAGAASTLASNWMATQPADGYTLYAAPVSLVINPILQGTVQYDARKDFEPISLMIDSPFVLQVHPGLGVRSMKELLARVREHPDRYAIGTSGAGSVNHLAAEYFLRAFHLKVAVVHYRGGAPAAQDLMGGTIQMMFSAANEAAPLMRSGRTVGIAVTTTQRLALLPDLPTMEEASGLRDFEAVFWMALVAPARTPAPVLARLREAMQRIGADPELRERLARLGVELVTSTPRDVQRRMDRDEAKWGQLIRELNIQEGT
ncbi:MULTISPECIES: tripartite tricarboxylate transporter substrate binding protein [unclassified Variovorax]|uniref:Bug family tripartite tricarboxylate transporter substrate binding protein n=1 Tax=unclassified Variovorax TaxID=663243 RepID=UPI002577578A|nr:MULTISPECIES: tripartite tricarboxylate transporter substrate binding protein [unclassified Variovorax]MDM0089224.1 tripartite tricarboxylate transporter substrate binding protein [Variovorax sp. J22G40]MDM0147297.1 tripartite tricarboxylate transporter substrate binding protein [Variovorax sp. J2P1-31]